MVKASMDFMLNVKKAYGALLHQQKNKLKMKLCTIFGNILWMVNMITDDQIEKAIDFMRDNSKKLAKAKAERIYLEEFRKSKKAILMRQAEVDGHKSSVAQEREAYASQEYIELLQGLMSAVEVEEELKWLMLTAEIKTEIWRTQSANNRSEGKVTR